MVNKLPTYMYTSDLHVHVPQNVGKKILPINQY